MATIVDLFGSLFGYLFPDKDEDPGPGEEEQSQNKKDIRSLFAEMAAAGPDESDKELAARAKRLLEELDCDLEDEESSPLRQTVRRRVKMRNMRTDTYHGAKRELERPPSCKDRYSLDCSDKLFSDLLDDVDNITGNTPSVHRRRRARDLFSQWLFSVDPVNPTERQNKRKSRQSFEEFTSQFGDLDISNYNKCSSYDQVPPTQTCNHWRDVARISQLRLAEDDADSGYNSGRLTKQHPSPGERTLTRADLRKQIEAFNKNNYGLVMNLHETDTTFQGFIRVHMNLIRPISMSITTRPPSIYEVLTSDGQAEREDIMCQSFDSMSSSCSSLGGSSTESFYLPKDTTKVIHIKSNITTQEVIRALLHKFKITDNPRKFALYEKTMHEGQKSVMRKMQDLEYPLQLCLSWTAEGLAQKKFVLHENDTMEIVWEAFSLPELDNFLRILDREEEEYVDQVKAKYALMKIHINQRLKELAPKPPQPSGDDTRQPVFV